MKCLKCGYIFFGNSIYFIKKHYVNTHDVYVNDRQLRHYLFSIALPQKNKRFSCIICNIDFVSNRDYYAHMLGMHTQMGGGGGDLLDRDNLTVEQGHIKTFKVVRLVKKYTEEDGTPSAFVNNCIKVFGTQLKRRFVDGTHGKVTIQLESVYVYKKMEMGMLMENGLPEKRVTPTFPTLKTQMIGLLNKLGSTVVNDLQLAINQTGSNWVFDRFISLTCRCTEDALLNSGYINQLIGGGADKHVQHEDLLKDYIKHMDCSPDTNWDDVAQHYFWEKGEEAKGMLDVFAFAKYQLLVNFVGRSACCPPEESMILDEAIDDKDISDSEDENIDVETEVDRQFIDDTFLDEDADEHRQLDQLRQCLPAPDEVLVDDCNLLDEPVPNDENQGITENSEHLSERELKNLNGILDQNLIRSTATDGSCVLQSIKNGIYYKKFSKVMPSVDTFKLHFPAIAILLLPYEEEIKYRTLSRVIHLLEEINDRLVQLGYAIHVYERKRRYYLVDEIETRKKTHKKVLAFAKPIYIYTGNEAETNIVHLVFEKLDDLKIHDMCVIKDVSHMYRVMAPQPNRNTRTRKVWICERCTTAFVRVEAYQKHVTWCKGTSSVEYVFDKSGVVLNTFETHIKNVESLPFTIYYDLETTTSDVDMEVTNYSYAVVFDEKLRLNSFVVFRSFDDDVESLQCFDGLPTDIHRLLKDDDRKRLELAAHDILYGKKHCLTQMLTLEIYVLQRIIQEHLSARCNRYANLDQRTINREMEGYEKKNCFLCGFSVNNTTTIPFEDSVRFCLRKIYMELYCRVTNLSMVHMSEEVFVSEWIMALDAAILDNRNDVQTTQADLDRGRLGLVSFVVSRAQMKLKTKFENRVFQMNSMLEEMLLEVLRDDVVVHHCHYTGVPYGVVHKRCNSRVRQVKKRMTNIYAHNARFDNKFLMKGLNVALLVEKGQKVPEISLLGENTEKIKMLTIGQCCFKDSYAVFESSLDELCKIKSEGEKSQVDKMLEMYLRNHPYFHRVLAGMDEATRKRAFNLVNDKGYYCYDYITSSTVLYEVEFPPLEAFNNKLKNKPPDPERYAHAKEIYELFQCRHLLDNACLYNIMDVINLAVIVESRMKLLQEYLLLNAKNYTSMSTYGAACATFQCRSILQQIPNESFMECIESSTHGGFSVVALRKAVSTAFYDPMYINDGNGRVRVMSTIEGLDENNQYGHKMTKKLCRGGALQRSVAPAEVLFAEMESILSQYKETDDTGYLFQVDMHYPKEQHICCSEETYPSVFTKEQSALSNMGPYQILHMRKKSKLSTRSFNKVNFNAKNMGTMVPKQRNWVMIDGLIQQIAAGWIVTRVHTYYSYLQDYIMKNYINQNQKRRMESKEAVVIKLMKDANNKAFGANTQRIKNRTSIEPLIDKMCEMNKAENYLMGSFKDSIATMEEREKKIELDYQDDVSQLDTNDPNYLMAQDHILQKRTRDMSGVDDGLDASEIVKKKSKSVCDSWCGNDFEDEAYRMVRSQKVRSFTKCTDSNSIKYLITKKPKSVNVKSTRYVGTDILTKAKVSIKTFADSICDCFNPVKNTVIGKDLDEMELETVIPSLILTDTDSVYFSFFGVFNTEFPNVEEEMFQNWVRESICVYCKERSDTSNMENTPLCDWKLRKQLNMFQFLTPTPSIKQIVAVNPKEYCCLFEKNEVMCKHKGVPKKVDVGFEVYRDRVKDFNFLKDNESYLKSEQVGYVNMRQEKNRTFVKETKKVKLGGLNDKVYIFSNGVTTLPHGHALLEPIYKASFNKTSEQLQSDRHINELLEIEKDIVNKHPHLKRLNLFYAQNIDQF